MLNLSSYVRTARNVITANSPMLLVGTAIAGVVTTGVLAAQAGYKARAIIDEAELEKGDLLTTQEKVSLTWLTYAAPGVAVLSTVAAVVGLHTIHTKRFNAMSGLYAVATTKLDEYSDKAEELLGTKKTQDLNNKIAQNNVTGNEPFDDREVYLLGDEGKQLCQDAHSGRWFKGSMATIEVAIANLNRDLQKFGEVNMNEFYTHLNLQHLPAPLGDMGWDKNRLEGKDIEARWGDATTASGERAISFWFHPAPKPS